MNIEKKQIDDLNIELTMTIAKDDYAAAEKKKLNAHQRTAEFKGFRKGMVPMALIQHVYGEQALVDAVNDIISEQLNSFIKDNQLRVLGEPLSSKDQPEIEWKDGNDFTFKFDIATSPEVILDLTKEDKIPYYEIEATAQGKDEMKTNILRQYGSIQEGEAVKEDDYVVVDLEQEGKKVEGTYVTVRNLAPDFKTKFIGAKADAKFDIDVNKVFLDENDRAAVLKVKKEELAAINPDFTMTIVNVKTFVPAEMNQETFDKAFGKDKVKSEEEFDKEVAARLEANYKQESDYRFSKDAKDYLVKKAAIVLPEDFLKRWLFNVNKGKFTMEDIEKEFPQFLEDFRWQMVREALMTKYNLKVEDKDMHEAAEGYVSYQYAMYGMANVPEEQLHTAAHQVLADEKQARQIEEQVEGQKVIAAVREVVSLAKKKISVEKFRELK